MSDPYLERLVALDDALAYQAQLNIDARDPVKAAACDNARLGLQIARDAYLLVNREEPAGQSQHSTSGRPPSCPITSPLPASMPPPTPQEVAATP